jgi:hypothetical protein
MHLKIFFFWKVASVFTSRLLISTFCFLIFSLNFLINQNLFIMFSFFYWPNTVGVKSIAHLPKVGHILGGIFPHTDDVESLVFFSLKTLAWKMQRS